MTVCRTTEREERELEALVTPQIFCRAILALDEKQPGSLPRTVVSMAAAALRNAGVVA